ncbi:MULTISPECIES: hypothetical protein [unclassified Rhizobium]
MAIGKKTGGRQKGSRNKATARREREIAKSGTTPLEYMLKVMRNPRADSARRNDMAKAAAPYVHPKLASMANTGPKGGPVQIQTVDLTNASDEQLEALKAIFGPLAGGPSDDDAGDPGGGGEA